MANTFYRTFSGNVGSTLTAVGNLTIGSSGGAIVIGLSITNTDPQVTYVDVTVNNGAKDFYITRGAPIIGGSTLVVVGKEQKLVLQPSDQVRVRSANGVNNANVDVTMSYMQTDAVGLTIEGARSPWVYSNAITYNTSLTSILYDGTKFVAISGAVSPYGNVGAVSTDGITWTQTSMVADTNLVLDLAYNGTNLYVYPLYGSRNVATSSDGITWTKQTNVIPDIGLSGGPAISTIAYGNGKFVALDQVAAVSYISTNGTSWSIGANVGGANTPGNLNAGFNMGIQYAAGTFLALNQSTYDNSTYKFFYSTDGVTWGNSAVTVSGQQWKYGYGGGVWVALPSSGADIKTGMISTDNGHTWSNVSLPNLGQKFGSVVHDGQRFIGISSYWAGDTTGYANGISSSDGVTWANLTMPAGSNLGSSSINKTSAYGAGRVVGMSGTVAYGNALILHSA